MRNIIPTSSVVKPVGRTMLMNDKLWMCYSATGASLKFQGKELQVILQGDDRCEMENMSENLARIKVFRDKQCIHDKMIDKKEIALVLQNSQDIEEHTYEILKVSESAMSNCAIKILVADDDACIYPTEKQPHFIEFAGDSITCGYGVDDEVAEHNFRTDTEDATKGYAYLACQQLLADHSLVSLSGYGIISGYSSDGLRRADQRLPLFYNKMGFSYSSFENVFPQDANWNFADRQPDLVVINLGTNDDSFTRDDLELQLEYCREYVAFLKQVRAKNPKAVILCILGMMGERLCPMVKKAVSDYCVETGDENLHFAHFTEQLAQDGRAADWHPSQLTHRKNAEKLSAVIRKIMQW